MTLGQWIDLAQILALVASTALNAWLFFRKSDEQQRREHAERMTKMERRQGLMSERVTRLETAVRHMPTHEDLNEIRDGLANANARLEAIDERSETTQSTVESIHRYLLENK